MILSLLFSVIVGIVSIILEILPNGAPFPTEFIDGMRSLWNTIWAWDFIFPVQTFINCVTIGVSFWVFVLVWRLVHWILRKIPALNLR